MTKNTTRTSFSFKKDYGNINETQNKDKGERIVRAISIATGKPADEIYKALYISEKPKKRLNKESIQNKKDQSNSYKDYLESLGWEWVSTPGKYFCKEALPDKETILVRGTGFVTAVIEGVIHDVMDVSFGGNKAIYGYYIKTSKK